VAAVERGYQLVTFEEREPTSAENDALSAALKLGDKGRREIRGHALQFYVDELRRTREATLTMLAARDDAWLEAPLRIAPALMRIGRGSTSPKTRSIIAARSAGSARACRSRRCEAVNARTKISMAKNR